MRRKYWLLKGRSAIKKHQAPCQDCRKWRAKPIIPKMADLPPARLRLFKPPFWSTGDGFISCRGKPFEILADRGANFRGAEAMLREAFQKIEPALKQELAGQQISFPLILHMHPILAVCGRGRSNPSRLLSEWSLAVSLFRKLFFVRYSSR